MYITLGGFLLQMRAVTGRDRGETTRKEVFACLFKIGEITAFGHTTRSNLVVDGEKLMVQNWVESGIIFLSRGEGID